MSFTYTNEHRWVVDGPVDGQDSAFRGAITNIENNPHLFDRAVDHNDPEDAQGFSNYKARHLRLFPVQEVHDNCYRRSCYMCEQLYIAMNEVVEPTPNMGDVRFLQKLYIVLLEALGRTPPPDTNFPRDYIDNKGVNNNADSDDDNDESDSDGSPDAGGQAIAVPLLPHSSVSSLVVVPQPLTTQPSNPPVVVTLSPSGGQPSSVLLPLVVPQPTSNQASSRGPASSVTQSTITGNNASSGTPAPAAPSAQTSATNRPNPAGQRADHSCIECRLKREGRCDKGLPGCSLCAIKGIECRYGTTVDADLNTYGKGYRGDRGGRGGRGGKGGRGGPGGSGHSIMV